MRADRCMGRDPCGRRKRGEPLYTDRPLVVGDLTHLRLNDKVFGCIEARRVVERVDDMEAALNKLSRVGHKGCTEALNWVSELGDSMDLPQVDSGL